MRRFLLSASAVALLCLAGQVQASPITLTFEGLGDLEPVSNYYNGGSGGNGSGPGPNYGITFNSDSLALIAGTAGGSGNFSNNPSGNTVLFFLSGSGAVMDVAAGFTTGVSLYYAECNGMTGNVSVYSGLDGTGSLLASLSLPATSSPYCVWAPVGVSFSGTAQSVIFSGTANYIGFDNITLGGQTPGGSAAAPEPASLTLLGFGAVGLLGYGWRRKKALPTLAC